MKSKAIFAVLAIAITLAMSINIAFAAPPPSPTANFGVVIACDNTGTSKTYFSSSEHVYVKLTSTTPLGSNAHIFVTRDSDSAVMAWFYNVVAPSGLLDCGQFAAGDYTVTAVGVNGQLAVKKIATATLTVVPESILGTLAATIAGFGAFATIGIVKRKHTKNQ